MKKRLLLIPLFAGLVLSGCGKDEPKGDEPVGGDELPPEDTTDHSPVLKEEFGDYQLAKELKDHGRYILGVYRHEDDIMRFFSGDYHRDAKGHYPFYMGTLQNFDDYEGAAEIEVIFQNETEFVMQVHAPGMVWDEKYIGVYSAFSSSENAVMSVAAMDSIDQEEYFVPDSEGNPTTKQTDKPSAIFKFHSVENDVGIYAPAADYMYTELGDKEATPKYLGTAGDFVSIDCKQADIALDGVEYDLAHLYELKEAE